LAVEKFAKFHSDGKKGSVPRIDTF
jgi:hypothetical protein